MEASKLLTLSKHPELFFLKRLSQLRTEADQLREALYLALPYVEDHEGSPAYKPQAVAQAVARIRKALGEPKQ